VWYKPPCRKSEGEGNNWPGKHPSRSGLYAKTPTDYAARLSVCWSRRERRADVCRPKTLGVNSRKQAPRRMNSTAGTAPSPPAGTEGGSVGEGPDFRAFRGREFHSPGGLITRPPTAIPYCRFIQRSGVILPVPTAPASAHIRPSSRNQARNPRIATGGTAYTYRVPVTIDNVRARRRAWEWYALIVPGGGESLGSQGRIVPSHLVGANPPRCRTGGRWRTARIEAFLDKHDHRRVGRSVAPGAFSVCSGSLPRLTI